MICDEKRNETKHCCVREHDEGGKRNSNPVLTMVNGRRRWKEEARVGWRERESPSDLASGYIYLREERRVRACVGRTGLWFAHSADAKPVVCCSIWAGKGMVAHIVFPLFFNGNGFTCRIRMIEKSSAAGQRRPYVSKFNVQPPQLWCLLLLLPMCRQHSNKVVMRRIETGEVITARDRRCRNEHC
jgi:hypothetical protein